jgi:hypothetical protein
VTFPRFEEARLFLGLSSPRRITGFPMGLILVAVLTDTANRVLLPGLQFGRINAVFAAPGASRGHGIEMNASPLMIRTDPYQAIQLPEVAAVIADQDVTKALVSR